MGIQPTPRKQSKGFEYAKTKALSQIASEITEYIFKNQDFHYNMPLYVHPERVIFDYPATIVYWNDCTKTAVVCHEGDVYDEHEGFLLCCAKKLFGNTGRYNDVIRENTPDGDQFHRALKIICHPAGAPCEGEQR